MSRAIIATVGRKFDPGEYADPQDDRMDYNQSSSSRLLLISFEHDFTSILSRVTLTTKYKGFG